jgi:hypothetical protein
MFLGLFTHNISYNQIVSPPLWTFGLDQTSLLYLQKSWHLWQVGFIATFKGCFGFIELFFQIDHEKLSFQGHGKT